MIPMIVKTFPNYECRRVFRKKMLVERLTKYPNKIPVITAANYCIERKCLSVALKSGVVHQEETNLKSYDFV